MCLRSVNRSPSQRFTDRPVILQCTLCSDILSAEPGATVLSSLTKTPKSMQTLSGFNYFLMSASLTSPLKKMLTLHIPKRCMMMSSINNDFFFAHIPAPCFSMTLTLWSMVHSLNFCFLSRVVHLNFTGPSVPVKAFPAVKSHSARDAVRSI